MRFSVGNYKLSSDKSCHARPAHVNLLNRKTVRLYATLHIHDNAFPLSLEGASSAATGMIDFEICHAREL